ncbi:MULTISPECIES: lysoplasmalogenase [unclassified Pseudomonas]|uniref:lysoplasmalogenase n=1 Tax=unclassified Pseudomonas TaxID=196821 RepID=UPI002449A937|nr:MULTISPECIES: lysoplasmalogenase [unclassified Pseudomonas]MDH0304312.1 lysoplasmalogenase [Pseudomonas sp. GD04091]MDH1983285.1 lysoplasmalogenase [Pseudomonas sp. GD03689]
MSRTSWLVSAALLGAVLYLCAVANQMPWLALASKPIPVLALLIWLGSAERTTYRHWIMLGLGFSLVGDIFLVLPADLFVFGLSAFLCAHLCYLAGYLGRTRRTARTALLFSLAVGGTLFALLASHGLGPLLVPVALYALAIGCMLWRALACGGLAALGACLFVFSDAMIGIDRFVSTFAWAPYLIILAYWLGQWLISASVVRSSTDKVLIHSGTRSPGSC